MAFLKKGIPSGPPGFKKKAGFQKFGKRGAQGPGPIGAPEQEQAAQQRPAVQSRTSPGAVKSRMIGQPAPPPSRGFLKMGAPERSLPPQAQGVPQGRPFTGNRPGMGALVGNRPGGGGAPPINMGAPSSSAINNPLGIPNDQWVPGPGMNPTPPQTWNKPGGPSPIGAPQSLPEPTPGPDGNTLINPVGVPNSFVQNSIQQGAPESMGALLQALRRRMPY